MLICSCAPVILCLPVLIPSSQSDKMQLLALVALVVSVASPASSSAIRHETYPTCRYLVGDWQWPSQPSWASLNASVDGRLIATVPLATVCHDPTYDEAKCLALQQTWPFSQTQLVPNSQSWCACLDH